jgi:hypothetical protein
MDYKAWNNLYFPNHRTYRFSEIIKKLRAIKVPSAELKKE